MIKLGCIDQQNLLSSFTVQVSTVEQWSQIINLLLGGMATGYPAVPEEPDPRGSGEEADRLSLAGEVLGQRQPPH